MLFDLRLRLYRNGCVAKPTEYIPLPCVQFIDAFDSHMRKRQTHVKL